MAIADSSTRCIYSNRILPDMKKVIVTGGAGFVGLHLARRLAEQGMEVVVADNFFRGKKDAEFEALCALPNVSFVQIDLTKPETLNALPTDVEGVYHLGAVNGTKLFYEMPDLVMRVNGVGVIHLLDWAATHGKPRILFTSSSEAYAGALEAFHQLPLPTPEDVPLVISDPKNVRWSYGASKMFGEVACHAWAKMFDLDIRIIRYHNIIGPRMGYEHVIPQFLMRIIGKADPFPLYGGDETRVFCDVRDAVRATQLVMERKGIAGETVHVGAEGEISMRALAEKMFAWFDVHPSFDVHPAPTGSVLRRVPDITKLKTLTGYVPEHDLEETVRWMEEWYREHRKEWPAK